MTYAQLELSSSIALTNALSELQMVDRRSFRIRLTGLHLIAECIRQII